MASFLLLEHGLIVADDRDFLSFSVSPDSVLLLRHVRRQWSGIPGRLFHGHAGQENGIRYTGPASMETSKLRMEFLHHPKMRLPLQMRLFSTTAPRLDVMGRINIGITEDSHILFKDIKLGLGIEKLHVLYDNNVDCSHILPVAGKGVAQSLLP